VRGVGTALQKIYFRLKHYFYLYYKRLELFLASHLYKYYAIKCGVRQQAGGRKRSKEILIKN